MTSMCNEKRKSAYQYEQISLSNGKSICDAQEIKSDQSHCNGSPDKFRAFFAKEQSDDRDDHNITGSDKAGFSDGCILDAKLLEIACQTEADTAGDTADNQSFFPPAYWIQYYLRCQICQMLWKQNLKESFSFSE